MSDFVVTLIVVVPIFSLMAYGWVKVAIPDMRYERKRCRESYISNLEHELGLDIEQDHHQDV
jgi:hypothetical protein